MSDIPCRLAKVETQVEGIYEKLEEKRRQSDRIQETLESIQRDVSKMRGFSMGVATVIGAIGSIIIYSLDHVFRRV